MPEFEMKSGEYSLKLRFPQEALDRMKTEESKTIHDIFRSILIDQINDHIIQRNCKIIEVLRED